MTTFRVLPSGLCNTFAKPKAMASDTNYVELGHKSPGKGTASASLPSLSSCESGVSVHTHCRPLATNSRVPMMRSGSIMY